MPVVAVESARPDRWKIRDGSISLARPILIGILNCTPDSFSDGGRYLDPSTSVRRARVMEEEGADVIDVGGESTRPGAPAVDATEEWRRIGPVVEVLTARGSIVSVDTSKTEIARRAVGEGARILNDVSGLRRDPEIANVAAESGAGLVLVHARGDPRTMQSDVSYGDLVGEVGAALRASADEAVRRGCEPSQVVVDPGIGFGKSATGSLELVGRVDAFAALGHPVLVGPSRKSFIGETLGLPVAQRVEGTIAACVVAFLRGARLFRVHDVRAVRRALDLAAAIETARGD